MFDSLTKLFEWKNINWKMTLRNQLKNVKIQNAETIDSYFTRVSQIKEQLEAIGNQIEEARLENMSESSISNTYEEREIQEGRALSQEA